MLAWEIIMVRLAGEAGEATLDSARVSACVLQPTCEGPQTAAAAPASPRARRRAGFALWEMQELRWPCEGLNRMQASLARVQGMPNSLARAPGVCCVCLAYPHPSNPPTGQALSTHAAKEELVVYPVVR
jgi:hypothetical protein